MRPRTSCTFCRLRKKRCVESEGSSACQQCRAKKRQCDLYTSGDVVESRRENEDASRGQVFWHSNTPVSTSPWSPLPVIAGYGAPPPSDCDELIELYFDMIHYKQHLLFHPPTFMQQYRNGEAADYLVLGMMALSARFSDRPFWQGICRTERSEPFLTKAIHRFYKRAVLIDIDSLQGAILLGFAAFADGSSEQESLLSAQAIRMVQLLDLGRRPGEDEVQREIANALLWQTWIMDSWHAGRGGYPRQVELPFGQPKIMEETMFLRLAIGQSDFETTLVNRNGIGTTVLPLHQVLNDVMKLNKSMIKTPLQSAGALLQVRQLDQTLQRWLDGLPAHMHYNPDNLARYMESQLGRTFLTMHVVYNYTVILLFFHSLKMKSSSALMTPEECEQMKFVNQCKSHATALSELMWSSSKVPGLECLWSPNNAHLLVVASCVHLHSLLIDDNQSIVAHARTMLERNFTLLMEMRKFWPEVERSLSRLRSFHRACQLSHRLSAVFDIDQWMVKFLIHDDTSVLDRQKPPHPLGDFPDDCSLTSTEEDIELLWKC